MTRISVVEVHVVFPPIMDTQLSDHALVILTHMSMLRMEVLTALGKFPLPSALCRLFSVTRGDTFVPVSHHESLGVVL